MTDTLQPKPVRASRITISQLMYPEHANLLGNVHGGWIMKLVDEAGALSCMRHAQRKFVTVAIDSMTFRQPIRIGDLIILNAEVTYTGRTSLEWKCMCWLKTPLAATRLIQTQPTSSMLHWMTKASPLQCRHCNL